MKHTIIALDNGLYPGRRQIIIWGNAYIVFVWSLLTNFSEILIEMFNIFIDKKCISECRLKNVLNPSMFSSQCTFGKAYRYEYKLDDLVRFKHLELQIVLAIHKMNFYHWNYHSTSYEMQ